MQLSRGCLISTITNLKAQAEDFEKIRLNPAIKQARIQKLRIAIAHYRAELETLNQEHETSGQSRR